jgi:hypothetical protein
MRNAKFFLCQLALGTALFTSQRLDAHCDTSPDLSAHVAEFESLRTSRIDALLRFGESHNLCFGIEYVDDKLLSEITDVRIKNESIAGTLKSILGERTLNIRLSNGIIEISQEESNARTRSIFDYVLPTFEVRRATVQEISNALHMQLVVDLSPQVTGFAGHYPTGDMEDQVGPISEHNRSIRYLLDELVARSKGGAWIAQIPWKLTGDFSIPVRRRVWAIVEYGLPKTGYAQVLDSIAANLQSDSSANISGPL